MLCILPNTWVPFTTCAYLSLEHFTLLFVPHAANANWGVCMYVVKKFTSVKVTTLILG